MGSSAHPFELMDTYLRVLRVKYIPLCTIVMNEEVQRSVCQYVKPLIWGAGGCIAHVAYVLLTLMALLRTVDRGLKMKFEPI